jgi:hypothetical protein
VLAWLGTPSPAAELAGLSQRPTIAWSFIFPVRYDVNRRLPSTLRLGQDGGMNGSLAVVTGVKVHPVP